MLYAILPFCPITARPGLATLRAKFVAGFGAQPLEKARPSPKPLGDGQAYTCLEWALANSVPTGTGGSSAKALLRARGAGAREKSRLTPKRTMRACATTSV